MQQEKGRNRVVQDSKKEQHKGPQASDQKRENAMQCPFPMHSLACYAQTSLFVKIFLFSYKFPEAPVHQCYTASFHLALP